MEIKQLKPSDLLNLVRLGEKFWAEGKLPGKFRPLIFIDSWSRLMDMGMAVILAISDGDKLHGALGMIIVPDINDGDLVANEAFWFVEPEYRGEGYKLLVKSESLAMQKGCKRMGMVHLESINSETLTKIYEKRGYKRTEVHYVKQL